jgi:hypothetical protein
MTKALLRRSAVALLAVCSASPVFAQAISNPDAPYVTSTTLLAMPASDFTTFTSLTGGGVTATFSSALERRTVGTNWTTWSSAPFSERPSATSPFAIGYSQDATSLTVTLSSMVSIFGFEAQPDPFAIVPMTATFFNGMTQVGQVVRNVDGTAGARLFAFQNAGGIDRVTFSTTDPFAIAQVRVAPATVVPEPSTYALMATGFAGLAVAARRRRRV